MDNSKMPMGLAVGLVSCLCDVNKCEKPTFLGKLVFLFYMKSSNFSEILFFDSGIS